MTFAVLIIIIMVLSSWQTIVTVHPVHLMNVERRQVAADPRTKPNDLGCEFACFYLLTGYNMCILNLSVFKICHKNI